MFFFIILKLGQFPRLLARKLMEHKHACYICYICSIFLEKQKLTNVELYGNLRKITAVIWERWLRIAGHCVRHKEEMANRLVLWQPTTGQRRRGRQSVSFVDCLLEDTGADNINEVETMMMDRELWRGNVRLGRAGARPRWGEVKVSDDLNNLVASHFNLYIVL